MARGWLDTHAPHGLKAFEGISIGQQWRCGQCKETLSIGRDGIASISRWDLVPPDRQEVRGASCKVCGAGFTNTKARDDHKRMHSAPPVKIWICQFCGSTDMLAIRRSARCARCGLDEESAKMARDAAKKVGGLPPRADSPPPERPDPKRRFIRE